MSFSADVKEELYDKIGSARHCRLAELAAIKNFDKNGESSDKNTKLYRKYRHLIELTGEPLPAYLLAEASPDAANEADTARIDGLITQQLCCKRAYIRGAFLAAGTVTDPNKSYHFEIAATSVGPAAHLREILNAFDITAGIAARKNCYVVYCKDSSGIVDILNVMEAHKSLMNLENVRIIKEVRENINRKVNCETANIEKTITASVKQIGDIEYIRDTIGLPELPDTLEEMARVRLEHPDTALSELGAFLSEPIGKSGVNHRLRRISQIAEQLRENTGGH